MHKRFRNPHQRYSRTRVKAEVARTVEAELHGAPVTPPPDGIAALMGGKAPSVAAVPVEAMAEAVSPTERFSPQSAQAEPLASERLPEPERKAVTRVVRGSAAGAGPRESSPAQRRIDRLLAMLRRSR